MGKNLNLLKSDIRINQENFLSCFIILRASLIGEYNIRLRRAITKELKNINIKDVENAKTLIELINVCNWDVKIENENIISVTPNLSETSEEKIMFNALAKFIEEEGRIEYTFGTSFTPVKKILIFGHKKLDIIKQPISNC